MWTELIRHWLRLWFWWLPSEPRQDANSDQASPSMGRSIERQEPLESAGRSSPGPGAASVPSPAPGERSAAPPLPQVTAAHMQSTAESTTVSAGAAAASAGDDLTTIKGIGPALRDKLSTLGLSSYAALAKADADWVARELKARQVIVSAVRVRQWIAAARERA